MSQLASRAFGMLELREAHQLAELGIPVVAERGRYGGYRLMPGGKLPPLELTVGPTGAAAESVLAKV
ncbi:hypothetical protein ACWDKQ_21000 [Saccharopolyspora sp. NPDC000995]